MKNRHRMIVIATCAILGLGAASPAFAVEDQTTELQQLMADSAPELLEDTDTLVAPTVIESGSEVTITPTEEVPETPDDAELIAPPTFTVDFADGVENTHPDGIVELAVADENSAAFMQPIENGFRVLTSTESPDGLDTFEYTLDVPADSQLVEMGEHIFIKSGEETVAILEHPWAKDANGADVPTSYSLENSVLTQHLDLSNVNAFPVLADPAWSYSLSYATNKTTYAVVNLLGSCFNCYFPVPGAPRAFPTVGQYLPLQIGPAPFHVTMATVSSNPAYTWFQYSFYATNNHVDGPGSAISFTFENRKLYVYAWITRDLGTVANAANRAGAAGTWSLFAYNLRNA